jgi:dUTP pyrophosphatase
MSRGYARSMALSETTVQVRTLSSRATVPAYHSDLAAGLDLSACLTSEQEDTGGIVLAPVAKGGRPVLIPCGFAMALAPGFEAQVRPRSGLAVKHGISMPNAPGTIDADYRGEVMVPLINLGPEPFSVRHGMRVAQMVIAPVARASVRVVDALDATPRGAGGFGSTGA